MRVVTMDGFFTVWDVSEHLWIVQQMLGLGGRQVKFTRDKLKLQAKYLRILQDSTAVAAMVPQLIQELERQDLLVETTREALKCLLEMSHRDMVKGIHKLQRSLE